MLVYSDRRAKRLRNIGANPQVALHLNDDGRGNDIVIVEGEARIDQATPPVTQNAAYLAKYGDWIRDELNSAEEMETIYNVPVWIRPTPLPSVIAEFCTGVRTIGCMPWPTLRQPFAACQAMPSPCITVDWCC